MVRGQHASREELFERTEVQVLDDRRSTPGDKRPAIANEDRAPIAKDPVGQAWRRLVKQDEVDGSACNVLET